MERSLWPRFLVAGVALMGAIVLATAVGPAGIPLDATVRIILSRLTGVETGDSLPALWRDIIWEVRLPRVLLAGLVGATLAVSGATYQAVFRNPLAEPYLIGVATGAALWTSAAVLDRMPVLIDGVGQLVQARYLAAGMLSGPRLAHPEFWQFQFMVLTDAGWVSQYPPGFSALLAAGWWLGAAWLVGPGLLGVAVYLTALIADRLFPSDPVVARMGAVLATVSPLLIFHAAGYMNHVLALALLTVALYASLRAGEVLRHWWRMA